MNKQITDYINNTAEASITAIKTFPVDDAYGRGETIFVHTFPDGVELWLKHWLSPGGIFCDDFIGTDYVIARDGGFHFDDIKMDDATLNDEELWI